LGWLGYILNASVQRAAGSRCHFRLAWLHSQSYSPENGWKLLPLSALVGLAGLPSQGSSPESGWKPLPLWARIGIVGLHSQCFGPESGWKPLPLFWVCFHAGPPAAKNNSLRLKIFIVPETNLSQQGTRRFQAT
jgi:hypothetical protein